MAMINHLLSVLGLVLLAGSLVHARHAIGMYGETKAYYGRDYDYDYNAYNTSSYASPERVPGWSMDWDVAERSYITQDDGLLSDTKSNITPEHGFVAEDPAGYLTDYHKCSPADDVPGDTLGKHHGHKKCPPPPGAQPAPSPSDTASDTAPTPPPSSDKARAPSPVTVPPPPSPATTPPSTTSPATTPPSPLSPGTAQPPSPATTVPPATPPSPVTTVPPATPPSSDTVAPPTPPGSPPGSDNSHPGTAPPSPSGGGTGNPVDDCWRHDPNWAYNRQQLALCAVGFGKNAKGGADGPIYVVTDESDDDLVNPKEGTLRYGVLQDGPLWIGFARDMTIKLSNELIMTSFKTIDGRGFDIHIAGGGGLTLQYISNVIIHGLHIHDTQFTPAAVIRSNSSHTGHRTGSDGDAVNIFGSHDVWVDHCYFARGSDGLVDGIMGSTRISVTNNFFEQHDKVMLFGAHPYDTMDGDMQVSVAYNHFAPGLIERTPRVRHGLAHVFNNYYASWGEYAIGGSEAPTILSEANVFNAPDTRDKQVTKRIDDGDASYKDSKNWNWQSVGDKFLNGAYFVAGGAAPETIIYSKAVSTTSVVPADLVENIVSTAGPLKCSPSGGPC